MDIAASAAVSPVGALRSALQVQGVLAGQLITALDATSAPAIAPPRGDQVRISPAANALLAAEIGG